MSDTIERRGLRDHVHDRLLELLLSGEVVPGERVKIDAIARRLDVSQTPVREALVQLERTGLVVREAHRGYRMAPPLEPSQLGELFEARLVIETAAARLATPASPEMLDELRAAEDRHRAAGARVIAELETGTPTVAVTREYFASDADFHAVVLTHCGNKYIAEMSEGLGALLHRMRQSVNRGVTDVSQAIAEHEAVLAAFEGEGPLDPEAAMRAHVEAVRSRALTEAALD